tara:strand:+ start:9475 stop:9702 length:228 start_codon:yes stop_codon:yes gene_type:complete
MDNYIILTESEFHSVDAIERVKGLAAISTDGRVDKNILMCFETVPAEFSSKTVYNRTEIDVMLRDTSGEFYTPNY